MFRFAVAAALGLFLAQDSKGGPCDLKTLGKAPQCGVCLTIDPKTDAEGRCCKAVPREIEVCVKTYYECAGCGKQSLDEAVCCKDTVKEKKVSKARTVFRCEGCGLVALEAGPCNEDSCRTAGKKVVKTCDASGVFPHQTR